jgi:pimeloyl-ACP methyl ester carboxylesterase
VLLDALSPWEGYAEELEAVLDQVGSEHAAIMAHIDAGPMALLFAASRPEQTSALVLVSCSAKWVATDDYPIGIPLEVAQGIRTQIDRLWGTDALVGIWAASRAGDQRFRRWSTRYQRAMASPRTIQAFTSVPSCRWCRRRRSCWPSRASRSSPSNRLAIWPSTFP